MLQSKTTQEFDIFRLWEIKKNRSRPDMQAMLQQVKATAAGMVSSELVSSKEKDGSSSLEIKPPEDDESSQGGFVPNEEDEQNDHIRAMREAAAKRTPDSEMNSYENVNRGAYGDETTHQIAATGATIGNTSGQKQQNFQ